MNHNKPFLFLCSSSLNMTELSTLKDLGTVLNLSDAPTDVDKKYLSKDFIVCNLKNVDAVDLLRNIDKDKVVSIAVLRKYESHKCDWVERMNPNFKIKDIDQVLKCKNKEEIMNLIKFMQSYKKPEGDLFYWSKKLLFLTTFLKNLFRNRN